MCVEKQALTDLSTSLVNRSRMFSWIVQFKLQILIHCGKWHTGTNYLAKQQ